MYRSSSKKHRTNIVLACNVNGNHIQHIRWFKNDIELQPLDDLIEFESHKLILKNPTHDTDGSYRCTAHNQIGTIRSDLYRLEVENDNAEPNVNRRHYGFKCAHHPHKKVSSDVIDHANKVSTTLLCRGKRSGFAAKRSADESAPDAMKQGARRQLSVPENRQAVLSCDLKHVDKNGDNVLVKWKRDGKLVRQVKLNGPASDVADTNIMENPMLRSDEHILLNNKNGSLIITATVPTDAGVYDCFVYKNSDSPMTVQSTELTIIEELKFSPKPTSKHLEIGSVGKLHCKVQGTPTPQVRWIKVTFSKSPSVAHLSRKIKFLFFILGWQRRITGPRRRHQRNARVSQCFRKRSRQLYVHCKQHSGHDHGNRGHFAGHRAKIHCETIRIDSGERNVTSVDAL